MDLSSTYWLTQSLAALPSVLWMVLGVGIPWALALLPRRDWQDRVTVLALALALGPGWVTAWMLVLGVIGGAGSTPLLRMQWILPGTVVIALIGLILAWRKRHSSLPVAPRVALATDEKLLIALIGVALVLRWFVTAFWPFTAYDALWVYGSQPRLYLLQGFIPPSIGYYPQFVQLQYLFAQLGVGTGFDDHAARAVIPFMHLGSILAAYVLGRTLFNRRVGIFTAAIWALYPHVGDWAHVGDLEIPLTFLFTLTAAFFLRSWLADETRTRRVYALLAGLVFGVAMWTKPTAGAFILGVMLLVAVELLRARLRWRTAYPRLETAVLTGLACIPLGSAWYLRNILLGHPAIDFPPSIWLTRARQSGDLFGWVLLALGLLLAYLYLRRQPRPNWISGLLGVALILAGTLPSMPWINSSRYDPPMSRITGLEWLAIVSGALVLAWTLWRYWSAHRKPSRDHQIHIMGWALLLAVPYFITWFNSYSYHYRLSFAIVPLLILPSAFIWAGWSPAGRWAGWRRGLYLLVVAVLALPGVLTTLVDTRGDMAWEWPDLYEGDFERYMADNPSLMLVVRELDAYKKEHGRDPVVVAPGEQRLPFFFPLMELRAEGTPTRLSELAGATHYIYGTQPRLAYEAAGIPNSENQIVSSLAHKQLMTPIVTHNEGTFRYELYQIRPDNRFLDPVEGPAVDNQVEETIVVGGFAQYVGDDLVNTTFQNQTHLRLRTEWLVLDEVEADYYAFIHLFNEEDGQVYARWEAPIAPGEHGHYSTRFWEAGEAIRQNYLLWLDDGPIAAGIPLGSQYRLAAGFLDPATGERLPVTIDGEPAGDYFLLDASFTVWLTEDYLRKEGFDLDFYFSSQDE